jgi:hypothetical protein
MMVPDLAGERLTRVEESSRDDDRQSVDWMISVDDHVLFEFTPAPTAPFERDCAHALDQLSGILRSCYDHLPAEPRAKSRSFIAVLPIR